MKTSPYKNDHESDDAFRARQKEVRLRDEFAMAALPALIARHRADVAWSDIARTAYGLADNMIKERG